MPENANRLSDLKSHLGRADGPCPERDDLDQAPPADLPPCQRLCHRCGRVTARRTTTGQPWCGGDPITAEGIVREIAPSRWVGV